MIPADSMRGKNSNSPDSLNRAIANEVKLAGEAASNQST